MYLTHQLLTAPEQFTGKPFTLQKLVLNRLTTEDLIDDESK